MAGILHPIEGVVYCEPALARKDLDSGGWIDRTIGETLGAVARSVPNKQAFICDERSITFDELDQVTDRFGAALLQIGLTPGDRAIFQMGTTVETAIALLGCYKVGVIPVCSLPQYREVEIGQLAAQCGAKGYIVQADAGNFDLVSFAKLMMQRQPTLQHLI